MTEVSEYISSKRKHEVIKLFGSVQVQNFWLVLKFGPKQNNKLTFNPADSWYTPHVDPTRKFLTNHFFQTNRKNILTHKEFPINKFIQPKIFFNANIFMAKNDIDKKTFQGS